MLQKAFHLEEINMTVEVAVPHLVVACLVGKAETIDHDLFQGVILDQEALGLDIQKGKWV